MTPAHFHVGVSSYSCSVIEATEHRDDGDVFEIPTWYPSGLLSILHMSMPLVAQVLSSDQLWCQWILDVLIGYLGWTTDSILYQGNPTVQAYCWHSITKKTGEVYCLKWYQECFNTLAVAQGVLLVLVDPFEAYLPLRQHANPTIFTTIVKPWSQSGFFNHPYFRVCYQYSLLGTVQSLGGTLQGRKALTDITQSCSSLSHPYRMFFKLCLPSWLDKGSTPSTSPQIIIFKIHRYDEICCDW